MMYPRGTAASDPYPMAMVFSKKAIAEHTPAREQRHEESEVRNFIAVSTSNYHLIMLQNGNNVVS